MDVTVQAVAPGGGSPDGMVTISDGQGGNCTANLGGGGSGKLSAQQRYPGCQDPDRDL